ncbi:MAG: zinc ribbon domain-containing protein [Chloroflexi bacterium]|nr:zinc ribbon domain-containing protein [Chloroflexota bacterium]
MNKINWTTVAILGIVVLVAFLIGASLLGGGSYWGMGPGMMGGFAPFGWVGMIFMWLFPLGFLVLTVLGIVWLVRALVGGPNRNALPTRACPDCGKSVQAGWRNCPHCGAVLSQA